jgi:hypothetical protein
LAVLKEQASAMRDELERILQRIEDLERDGEQG